MGCFKMEKSNAKNNSDFFRRRKTNQNWKPGFFPTEQVGFLESFSGIISYHGISVFKKFAKKSSLFFIPPNLIILPSALLHIKILLTYLNQNSKPNLEPGFFKMKN